MASAVTVFNPDAGYLGPTAEDLPGEDGDVGPTGPKGPGLSGEVARFVCNTDLTEIEGAGSASGFHPLTSWTLRSGDPGVLNPNGIVGSRGYFHLRFTVVGAEGAAAGHLTVQLSLDPTGTPHATERFGEDFSIPLGYGNGIGSTQAFVHLSKSPTTVLSFQGRVYNADWGTATEPKLYLQATRIFKYT